MWQMILFIRNSSMKNSGWGILATSILVAISVFAEDTIGTRFIDSGTPDVNVAGSSSCADSRNLNGTGDLASGLKLYYPFTTNDGATATDASGNGQHGTVVNAKWRAAGPQGGYYYFDGNADYVNAGTGVNFPAWAQYSISVWLLNDGGGDNTGYGQKILDKTSFNHDAHIRLVPDANAWINLHCYEGGVTRGLNAQDIRVRGDNLWHHFVVVRDGTNCTGWLDGVKEDAINNMISVNSSSPLYIGYSASSDVYQRKGWSGFIDEVRIYDRAITSNEVSLLFRIAKPPCTLTVENAQGDAEPANGTHAYVSGDAVSASVPVSVTEGTTRYVCTGATVTGNGYAQPEPNRVTLTVTNNATLTWNWQTQYRLTVRTEGDGSVSAAGEWQNGGTNVALTATPAAHALFAGWEGDTNACLVQGGAITAPMTQARALTAVFLPKTPLVTFDPQGGTVSPGSKVVTFGAAYGFLPDPFRAGHIFTGWLADTNGVVFGVASDTAVSVFSDHTLRANWIEDPILSPPEDTAAFSSPGSYDGFLYSEDAFGGTSATAVRGTLSLKITSLTGKLTAKALVRTGPLNFISQKWPSTDTNGTCHASLTARGGETLDLYVSQDRIWGTLAGGTFGAETLTLDGARNRFGDREDAAAQRLLDAYRGYYTVALPPAETLSLGDADAAPGGSGYLTLTVGNGGGAKIAGRLADGTPVSQSSVLIPFNGEGPGACVPFFTPLYARKGWTGGLLWIDPTSRAVVTDRYLGWFIRWENPGAGRPQ